MQEIQVINQLASRPEFDVVATGPAAIRSDSRKIRLVADPARRKARTLVQLTLQRLSLKAGMCTSKQGAVDL